MGKGPVIAHISNITARTYISIKIENIISIIFLILKFYLFTICARSATIIIIHVYIYIYILINLWIIYHNIGHLFTSCLTTSVSHFKINKPFSSEWKIKVIYVFSSIVKYRRTWNMGKGPVIAHASNITARTYISIKIKNIISIIFLILKL